MATKVIIPTSYGSPSATFWINDQKYVLPTGVEVTAPDEVALLISQHEAQKKRENPQYLPDVVDVVFTFDSFTASGTFNGKASKKIADISREMGDRGVEVLNLKIVSPETLSMPFRIAKNSYELIVWWIGINAENITRVYKATLTAQSDLNVVGVPIATITSAAI